MKALVGRGEHRYKDPAAYLKFRATLLYMDSIPELKKLIRKTIPDAMKVR